MNDCNTSLRMEKAKEQKLDCLRQSQSNAFSEQKMGNKAAKAYNYSAQPQLRRTVYKEYKEISEDFAKELIAQRKESCCSDTL